MYKQKNILKNIITTLAFSCDDTSTIRKKECTVVACCRGS